MRTPVTALVLHSFRHAWQRRRLGFLVLRPGVDFSRGIWLAGLGILVLIALMMAHSDPDRMVAKTDGLIPDSFPARATLVDGERRGRPVLILIDGGHSIMTVHSGA